MGENKLKKLKVEQGNLKDTKDDLSLIAMKWETTAIAKPINKALELVNRKIDRNKVRIEKQKAQDRHPLKDIKPHVVLERNSPNQSLRSSPKISLIVLHSTESDNKESSHDDLAAVANWFANPSSQVSSHVIVDSDGHSARCVPDSQKAWTQGFFNSASLSIEQVGRASQSRWEVEELEETARWIALWCYKYRIPCQIATVSGKTIVRPGIISHKALGELGGNHNDPGVYYPIDDVLKRAKHYLERYNR